MRKILQYLLVFILLAYSFTSSAQICVDTITTSTPNNRFKLDGPEVTDLKTGLIWQRCSAGKTWKGEECSSTANTYDWTQALALTSNKWRLPNIKELSSIVESSCISPAINLSIFPDSIDDYSWYWSSSISSTTPYFSYLVSFHTGETYEKLKSQAHYVRLVRTGE